MIIVDAHVLGDGPADQPKNKPKRKICVRSTAPKSLDRVIPQTVAQSSTGEVPV